MTTEPASDPGTGADFGAEFRPLSLRIRRALASPENGGPAASARRRSWREESRLFEHEAEALIAKHQVEDPLATYVRHVAREGFDVEFDPMDPTPPRAAE